MTNIEPETTKLVITMKHVWYICWALGGAVVILAIIGWGILSLSLSGVQDDIKDVRADIRGLSGADKDSTDKSAATEIGLRDLIASLDKNVFAMSENLASFTKTTDGQLQALNANFSDMRGEWKQTNDAVLSISDRLLRIEERVRGLPLNDGGNPDLQPPPLPQPQ
jgi:hypothetical protein